MSGGSFDYFQYKIDDAVNDIEEVIRLNAMTVAERWDALSDEDKERLGEDEQPWTKDKCPYWVVDEAQEKADAHFGIDRKASGSFDSYCKFMSLSTEQRKEWSRIRNAFLDEAIEQHNTSIVGMDFSPEVIAKMKEMLPAIKKAKIFLDRIDYLLAGDDGEESFLKRTEEELKEAGLED